MDVSMLKRMKELEEENRRLKKMYAEERLKAEIVQEALKKVSGIFPPFWGNSLSAPGVTP